MRFAGLSPKHAFWTLGFDDVSEPEHQRKHVSLTRLQEPCGQKIGRPVTAEKIAIEAIQTSSLSPDFTHDPATQQSAEPPYRRKHDFRSLTVAASAVDSRWVDQRRAVKMERATVFSAGGSVEFPAGQRAANRNRSGCHKDRLPIVVQDVVATVRVEIYETADILLRGWAPSAPPASPSASRPARRRSANGPGPAPARATAPRRSRPTERIATTTVLSATHGRLTPAPPVRGARQPDCDRSAWMWRRRFRPT